MPSFFYPPSYQPSQKSLAKSVERRVYSIAYVQPLSDCIFRREQLRQLSGQCNVGLTRIGIYTYTLKKFIECWLTILSAKKYFVENHA